MEKGIHLYNHGAYREAKNCFNKAIIIDTEDFESNFWLLRTLTMLHEYDAAETLAVRCAKLEPRVASQLVVPWQEVIKIKISMQKSSTSSILRPIAYLNIFSTTEALVLSICHFLYCQYSFLPW